jgi:hypothetical protein
MDLLDIVQQKKFLGPEFLTWLWYQSEKHGGVLTIAEQDAITLWLDDRLELESSDPSDQRNMLAGGAPSTSPEARAALKEHRKASNAKIRIAKGEREWAFQLDAKTLDIKSVKIPALLTSEEDDKFFERVHLIEELKEVVEALYKRFIKIRTCEEWTEERNDMARWVNRVGDFSSAG